MPDNTIRAGAQTRNTSHHANAGRNDLNINVRQTQDLRIWTRKFGVTVESLKEAVRAVGTDAEAVQRYLQEAEADEGPRH